MKATIPLWSHLHPHYRVPKIYICISRESISISKKVSENLVGSFSPTSRRSPPILVTDAALNALDPDSSVASSS